MLKQDDGDDYTFGAYVLPLAICKYLQFKPLPWQNALAAI
jgi:hypothetical protein